MTLEVSNRGDSLAFSGDWIGRSSPYSGFSSGTIEVRDTFQMASTTHTGWTHSSGDAGGPWLLIKRKNQVGSLQLTRIDNGNLLFQGPVICGYPPPGLIVPPDSTPLSNGELDGLGATLVSRATPTRPTFGLARSIGELKKDGIPDIIGGTILRDKTHALKDTGDEYLNAQFGWAPLMSDVRKFAQTVKDSNHLIRSHSKSGQKHVRRRRSFPTESSFETYQGSDGILLPSILNTFADVTAGTSYLKEIWFSGAFKYYIPVPDNLLGRIEYYEQQSNLLLGTRLTPQVVWQLAPWSWAVDWFSNTGDVISNISALTSDSLVMQYGYVMCHTERSWYTHMTRPAAGDPAYGGLPAIDLYRKYTHSVKQRRPANPFGFGLTWDGLTPYQASIALALGLSRT